MTRQHPLTETLAQLSREPVFQRILLQGLGEEHAESFIRAAAGVTPSPGLVATIHTQTEGNPFFMTEVVRLLGDRGELSGDGQPAANAIQIPDGVRNAIGQRLNRLSAACNETLTIASVVGREFTVEHLRSLIEDMTEDRLLEVLEEALAARVIEELPQSVGRYQFAHGLIQETLAGELSTTRKVRLHARIAEALVLLYGADAVAHAAELAFHFGEAATVLGSEKLIRYCQAAGARALTTYAYEEALAHFEHALTATGASAADIGPARDPDTAAALFGLGRAQLATFERAQWPQALVNLYRSFDYYVRVGDVSAAVAIGMYDISPWPGVQTRLAELIAQALVLVPQDSLEAGRLLSQYGMVIGREEDRYEEAQEAFARALVIAQREGDTALEMRTLANAVPLDFRHFRYQDGVEKGLRAIELASQIDYPLAEMDARVYLSAILFCIGELEEAEQQTMELLAVAERIRDRSWLAFSLFRNAQVSSFRGDWGAARDFTDRGLTLEPRDLPNLAARISLEHEVGEFGQGEHYLERMVAVMRQTVPGPTFEYAYPAMVIPLVARTSGVVEKFDIARSAAETVVSWPSVTPFIALYARAGLAWLAVQLGDIEAAEEQYAALENHRGTLLPVTLRSVDRLLGLLAQTMGNLDQAVDHFEDALAFCRKADYRPELAWTCHDYADCLLARNKTGDPQRAMTLLDEALTISSELGMRPITERVVALQKPSDASSTATPTYAAGLTQREVEVLRLVASGQSNREIAAELVLSARTVERHLTNIYSKISARGRVDATAYALSHDLLDQK